MIPTNISNDRSQLVITPAALLELLGNITELSDYSIAISESPEDTSFKLYIGDSTYDVAGKVEDIPVDTEVIDDVIDINLETYDELESSGQADINVEPIQSGLIKEAIKSLALGGLIRLTKKLLTE